MPEQPAQSDQPGQAASSDAAEPEGAADAGSATDAELAIEQPETDPAAVDAAPAPEPEPVSAYAAAGTGGGVIEDGYYTVSSALAGLFVWDIAGGSLADGGNLQLWGSNGTNAQLFRFAYANGYYTITAASGKVLDAAGAGRSDGTNIQQYASNDTDAQKWSVEANSDGTYTLVNKVNGLAADVSAGVAAAGTNLQCYSKNGTPAQRFVLNRKTDLLWEGTYKIASALGGAKVLDVSGGSRADGANVQLYDGNATQAQKWSVKKVAGRENTYTVRSLVSGKFLTLDPDGNVCQRAERSDGSQHWTTTILLGRNMLANAANGLALDILGGSTANGANAQGYAPNGSAAQLFLLEPTALLDGGTYVVRCASLPGQVIDVSGGSVDDHANVQSWEDNGSGAQKWNIEPAGDGSYRITSVLSGKALDVQDAKADPGRNVQIFSSSDTPAQKWWLSDNGDGTFSFATALDLSMRLAVSGSPESGANVCIGNDPARFSQRFIFEPTSYRPPISGDPVLDGYVTDMVRGRDLWQAFVAVSRYPYHRTWDHPDPAADWTTWAPSFARQMYENGHGNCFRYAALFAYCARALGYDARVVAGSVPARAGGWAPHGWVLINEGGSEYLYDPDMYKAYPRRNWFRVTYATAPLNYRPGAY